MAVADEFAERGLDASVADIARRAGLGKGTLFRHFATKADLLAAIVLDRIDELNAVGEQLLDAADPSVALLEVLTVAADQQQQLDLSLRQEAGELDADVIRAREWTFRIVHALVDRAREHGAVRTDVTGADVILLCWAPN